MTSAGKPPGPKGLPLIGNLVDFDSDVLAFLTESARRYGDVVAMRLGSWPTLLLSNSDDIEKVLVKEHENFVKHSFFWRHVTALFGSGLLTSEGELWHRQRRLAAPVFAGGQLQGYGTAMVCHTERMLENWRDGETRNLHAEMMALTLEIAAKTLFDSEIAEDVSQIDHALNDLTGEITARFKRPFVVPDFVPLPGHIRYRRAIARIERLIDRLISERRSAKPAGTDLLSKLMAARDENGQPMSDRQLRDEAITLILAGHETTALALSWTCYLLGRHSDVQAELAAEVGGLLHGHCAIVEDLPSLRFAQCVVTEAMRLYPPVWTIGREAVRDCELGGYARTGTHHDPDLALGDTPRPAQLRPPRRIPTRPMGGWSAPQAAEVRLLPLRRRPAHLHRPALCDDGSGSDSCHDRAPLQDFLAPRPKGDTSSVNYAAAERRGVGDAL